MENNNNVEATASPIEKLLPGLDRYKAVFADNRERVDRALLVSKSIVAVPDEAQDKHAENFLVKARVTIDHVSKKRLESTRILDEAKEWAMGPERELKAEMDRIKKLRDVRARGIADAANAQAKAIEMEKQYKIYEAEVKGAMQLNLQLSIAKKITELENAIADMFNKSTLITLPQVLKFMESVKPNLKQEFYNSIFQVPYNQSIMPVAKYDDLVARAQGFQPWSYTTVNEQYTKLALETVKKWIDKVPSKKIELERIAKGGEDAERLKKEAAARAARDEEQRKKDAAILGEKAKSEAQDQVQKATLSAEFQAQGQNQELEQAQATSVRKTTRYRLNPAVEIDMMKLSTTIGKLVLHVALDRGQHPFKGIFKMDKNGVIKNNEFGEHEYIDGIQYWLDEIAKLKYSGMVDGLISTEKISTVAKAPKP
jgi:hypothetical protein